ncbi:MAG: galactose-1-phosphate uridylyltransferase [Alphaproteobacteria bacterium]|nr:galactose-1-phosphate uridylyltransferase [Alphaproteobacteria bacterium]
MPDGRTLHLYGNFEGRPVWPADQAAAHTWSHRRWHPVRREWVVYSAHRQGRTYKPAAEACPFCPHADGEIPVKDFSVAVFDNRFSSLQKDSPRPDPVPGLDLPVESAAGNCEVIVYSSDHRASMGTLSAERRELLVRVWAERVRALMQIPAVQFVMPFENRGEEAGVTLHHPHGQIYAFSYLPPIVEDMAASFRGGYRLEALAANQTYAVAQTATMSAFVPPFARFPYEVWVAPKRAGASLLDLSDGEVSGCGNLLGRVAGTYDAFFGRVCPYVMIVYVAPRGMEAFFPFHIQFYPLLRSHDRLKYLAGCELGAGSFLVDILPEDAAKSLRAVDMEKSQ